MSRNVAAPESAGESFAGLLGRLTGHPFSESAEQDSASYAKSGSKSHPGSRTAPDRTAPELIADSVSLSNASTTRASLAGRQATSMAKSSDLPSPSVKNRRMASPAEGAQISYERALQIHGRRKQPPLQAPLHGDGVTPSSSQRSNGVRPTAKTVPAGTAPSPRTESLLNQARPIGSANGNTGIRTDSPANTLRQGPIGNRAGYPQPRGASLQAGSPPETVPTKPKANVQGSTVETTGINDLPGAIREGQKHPKAQGKLTTNIPPEDHPRREVAGNPGIRKANRSRHRQVEQPGTPRTGPSTLSSKQGLSSAKRSKRQPPLPDGEDLTSITSKGTIVAKPDVLREETALQRNELQMSLVDQRKSIISIRLTESEIAQLRDRADESGISVSAYMRSCVLEAENLRSQVKQALAEMRSLADSGSSGTNSLTFASASTNRNGITNGKTTGAQRGLVSQTSHGSAQNGYWLQQFLRSVVILLSPLFPFRRSA